MTTNLPAHPPVDGWSSVLRDNIWTLTRTWRFPDWNQALAFVNQVSDLAEQQKHHPVVEFTWGRVTLWVWTHDTGTVTAQDTALCEAINTLM